MSRGGEWVYVNSYCITLETSTKCINTSKESAARCSDYPRCNQRLTRSKSKNNENPII